MASARSRQRATHALGLCLQKSPVDRAEPTVLCDLGQVPSLLLNPSPSRIGTKPLFKLLSNSRSATQEHWLFFLFFSAPPSGGVAASVTPTLTQVAHPRVPVEVALRALPLLLRHDFPGKAGVTAD